MIFRESHDWDRVRNLHYGPCIGIHKERRWNGSLGIYIFTISETLLAIPLTDGGRPQVDMIRLDA